MGLFKGHPKSSKAMDGQVPRKDVGLCQLYFTKLISAYVSRASGPLGPFMNML